MTLSSPIRLAVAALAVVGSLAAPAAAQSIANPGPEQVVSGRPNEMPAGQELDVRLLTTLDSDTAQPEDRFEATTVVDLVQDGRVLVPAGSVVRGLVRDVHRASRTQRAGELTLSFDEVVIGGQTYQIRANAVDTIKSEGIRGEAGRIAAGAGVGAIVGGIIGGVKGALAGILIGAGGTIAATEGKDVKIPEGTVLRIRLEEPVWVGR
jgi:hypothetical protein